MNQYSNKRYWNRFNTTLSCSNCKEIKDYDCFHIDKSNKYGYAYYCKECANLKSRQNHTVRFKNNLKYKQDKKDSYIKNRYGITLQEYEAKLAQQNYSCAICGVKLSNDDPNTHLDHCHRTGKLRAFLCTNCNRGLGHFKDSNSNLLKAIDYLNSHSEYVHSQKGVSQ